MVTQALKMDCGFVLVVSVPLSGSYQQYRWKNINSCNRRQITDKEPFSDPAAPQRVCIKACRFRIFRQVEV